LVSVTFESGSQLRIIEQFAFAECVSVVSICIPASVENLEDDCFGGIFPDETDHCDCCFRFCISLESITFEKDSKLKKIGERAFPGWISLRSICISASVESIGQKCFGLTVSDEFYRCKALEYVIIESGSMLREVGVGIFSECDALHRIEIFPDFTRIQRNLFHDQESNFWVKKSKTISHY
jgi:hypothetical protein